MRNFKVAGWGFKHGSTIYLAKDRKRLEQHPYMQLKHFLGGPLCVIEPCTYNGLSAFWKDHKFVFLDDAECEKCGRMATSLSGVNEEDFAVVEHAAVRYVCRDCVRGYD